MLPSLGVNGSGPLEIFTRSGSRRWMHLPRTRLERRGEFMRNRARRCFSSACPGPKGPLLLARNDEPERDPAAKKLDHGSGLCTRIGELRGDFAEQLPVL